MVFSKRIRDGVRNGEITCSVRFWTRQRVSVGARYRVEDGEIEIDSVELIGFPDISPTLARESGFLGVLDLLKVAKHGKGELIYLVRFHFVPPSTRKPQKGK
jgi:hypothetical protein